MERLFKAYHEQKRDISDHGELCENAKEAGMNASEVEEWLASGLAAHVVDREAQHNKESVTLKCPI